MTSLAPPSPADPPSLTPPPPIEVKTEPPAEGKTEDAESAEQQWHQDGNAEPVEGFDDADYSEDKADEETDDEEGNVEPGYRPPSPITPDGIEEGNSKVDPITPDGIEEGKVEPEEAPHPKRRPAPEEAPQPRPKRRRTGPELWGPGGPAFGTDATGRPEVKPPNYYGFDFEPPSQRLSRIRIDRGNEPRSWVKIAKVCKFWYEYCCTNGNFCTYAHARDELGKYIRCAPRSPLPSTRRRRRR